jgi:hypothetical protein
MAALPPKSNRNPRRAAFVLLAVALLALASWRGCANLKKPGAVDLGFSSARRPEAAGGRSSIDPPRAAPPADNGGSTPPSASRMRALTFTIDAAGIRLEQALSTAGRVKALPQSIAPHRLEFEVYNQAGEKIHFGAIDHPLHRSLEYEDPARPGELRRTVQEVAQDSFLVRLPEPLPAGRIIFFEVRPVAGAPLRTEVATLPLPGPAP